MSVAVADFDEETDRGNSENKRNISFFSAVEKKISKLVKKGNKSQKQANKIANVNY